MSTTTELYNWLNGTPTGGPNGDGRYPLTAKDGTVFLVYCPAAQALNPTLAEQPVEVFAQQASAAATDAAADASLADQHRISAATSAANAAASATAASTSVVAAHVAAADPHPQYLTVEAITGTGVLTRNASGDLRGKALVAGANTVIVEDANSITLSATGGGAGTSGIFDGGTSSSTYVGAAVIDAGSST